LSHQPQVQLQKMINQLSIVALNLVVVVVLVVIVAQFWSIPQNQDIKWVINNQLMSVI